MPEENINELAARVRQLEESLIRREEELRRSQKLASVGLLLSGVAHELNSPLMSVLGHAQILLADTPAGSQLHTDLAVIEMESKRCQRIIKNLLAYTRKQEQKPVWTDLNKLVLEILELKAFDFRRSQLAVIQDLSRGPLPVFAVPGQIQQVLLNLLNNAEQAMQPKGNIRVQTRREQNDVVLSVADSGPGIPPEVRARIFEPFFTTKEAGKGTGLGLSICAEIAERHGGRLSVESEPGRGACFHLRIPVPEVESAESPAGPSRGLVLVVDDEENLLALTRRALQQAGWTVEGYRDPAQALEALRRKRFDVVLSDFIMNGLNGDAFYRLAIEARPELARRFILCTGGDIEEARAVLDEDGVPVLQKPLAIDEFDAAVSRLRSAEGAGAGA